MVEPLIRWLKSLNNGYTPTHDNITIYDKCYADGATLVASTVTDLNTQLDAVNTCSK